MQKPLQINTKIYGLIFLDCLLIMGFFLDANLSKLAKLVRLTQLAGLIGRTIPPEVKSKEKSGTNSGIIEL